MWVQIICYSDWEHILWGSLLLEDEFRELMLNLPDARQRKAAHPLLPHFVKVFILGHSEVILPVTCYSCPDREIVRRLPVCTGLVLKSLPILSERRQTFAHGFRFIDVGFNNVLVVCFGVGLHAFECGHVHNMINGFLCQIFLQESTKLHNFLSEVLLIRDVKISILMTRSCDVFYQLQRALWWDSIQPLTHHRIPNLNHTSWKFHGSVLDSLRPLHSPKFLVVSMDYILTWHTHRHTEMMTRWRQHKLLMSCPVSEHQVTFYCLGVN